MGRTSYSERSGNVVTLRIGDSVFPVALKAGRKVYRVCPVCGALLETSSGWFRHLRRYHSEWIEYINMYRIKELLMLIGEEGREERVCIRRLKLLIGQEKTLKYCEYDRRKGEFKVVGYVYVDRLLKFLENYDCKLIDLRRVEWRKGGAYVGAGKRTTSRYLKAGENRFVLGAEVMDALKAQGLISRSTIGPSLTSET